MLDEGLVMCFLFQAPPPQSLHAYVGISGDTEREDKEPRASSLRAASHRWLTSVAALKVLRCRDGFKLQSAPLAHVILDESNVVLLWQARSPFCRS